MRITFSPIKINNNFKSINNKNNKYVTLPKIAKDEFVKSQVVFGGARCSEGNFKIKDIKHLHCPACGLLMLNKKEQAEFIADVAGKKGEDLAFALEKYEDESVFVDDESRNKKQTIYRPQKQEIVDIIKELACDNPSLTLSELVQLKAKECLSNLIEHQMEIVDELECYIDSSLDDEELIITKAIIEEYKKQIKGESPVQFKRKSFIHALSKVAKDSTVQNTITQIISKLPTSDTTIDSFFVKYSKNGRTSKEIASKFVAQSKPTAEHLLPKSKGGKDNTANYICDCADCNSSRGNTDFAIWQKEKPGLKQNLQEYLIDVQKALDEGFLGCEYDSYIEEIIETISRLSNGEIELKAPKVNNDEKYQAMIQKRKAQVVELSQRISNLCIRRKEIKKEMALLEQHPQYRNIVQYEILQAQIKEGSLEVSQLSKEARTIREKRISIEDKYHRLQDFEADVQKHPHIYDEEEILDYTGGKTSQELLMQIEASKAKEEQINTKIKQIEERMDVLRQKRTAISELGLPMEELETSLNAYKERISKIEQINSNVAQLKESIFDESYLLDRLKDIQTESNELLQMNQQIQMRQKIEQESFEYGEYRRYDLLYEKAESMEEDFANNLRAKEVVQIAKDSIRDKMCELWEVDSVRYQANLDSIDLNNEEEKIIQSRIVEIEEIKTQIAQQNAQLDEIMQGQTLQEIFAIYQDLSQQKETIDKIRNISDLRNEVEILNDTIEYNKAIYRQLKAYRILTSEEFKRLVSLIY